MSDNLSTNHMTPYTQNNQSWKICKFIKITDRHCFENNAIRIECRIDVSRKSVGNVKRIKNTDGMKRMGWNFTSIKLENLMDVITRCRVTLGMFDWGGMFNLHYRCTLCEGAPDWGDMFNLYHRCTLCEGAPDWGGMFNLHHRCTLCEGAPDWGDMFNLHHRCTLCEGAPDWGGMFNLHHRCTLCEAARRRHQQRLNLDKKPTTKTGELK